MRRDTFSLTAIKETNYSKTSKLPEISSDVRREIPNRLSRTRTQGSLGPSKHKVIKDLLTSIQSDSER